jgi:hypothetical protein
MRKALSRLKLVHTGHKSSCATSSLAAGASGIVCEQTNVEREKAAAQVKAARGQYIASIQSRTAPAQNCCIWAMNKGC